MVKHFKIFHQVRTCGMDLCAAITESTTMSFMSQVMPFFCSSWHLVNDVHSQGIILGLTSKPIRQQLRLGATRCQKFVNHSTLVLIPWTKNSSYRSTSLFFFRRTLHIFYLPIRLSCALAACPYDAALPDYFRCGFLRLSDNRQLRTYERTVPVW